MTVVVSTRAFAIINIIAIALVTVAVFVTSVGAVGTHVLVDIREVLSR